MTLAEPLLTLIIAVIILVGAWFIVERFSPDPLVTKLCQLLIFAIALYLVVTKLLPLVH